MLRPARARRGTRALGEVLACPVEPISLRQIDCTRIAPRLWQGGVHGFNGCRIAIKSVDIVVLLAPDAEVQIASPRPVLLDLRDSASDLHQLDILHPLAAQLARAIRRGKRVLILCHEGRNRSGLVTGLTLWNLGYLGRDAVRLIKSRRRDALSNEHFARYLKTLG